MEEVMLSHGNRKLVAKEGYRIKSKSTHWDEELEEEIPDVEGELIYLGKNDRAENYEAVEVGNDENGKK